MSNEIAIGGDRRTMEETNRSTQGYTKFEYWEPIKWSAPKIRTSTKRTKIDEQR